MLAVLISLIAVIGTVLGSSGYYFYSNNAEPYNCYWADIGEGHCAMNCSYYTADPYCGYLDTLGSCSATACDPSPTNGSTYCQGCPYVNRIECAVDSGGSCPCSFVSIPLADSTCNSTGPIDGVEIADGAYLDVKRQLDVGSIFNAQYLYLCQNASFNTTDGTANVQFSSALFGPTGSAPENISCNYDGVHWANYNASTGNVTTDCNLTVSIDFLYTRINAQGPVTVSGETGILTFQEGTSFAGFFDNLPIVASNVSSGTVMATLQLTALFSSPASCSLFETCFVNVSTASFYVSPGTNSALLVGNSLSFSAGEEYHHSWTVNETVTIFDIPAIFHMSSSYLANESYFTIEPYTIITRPLVVTNCSEGIVMSMTGYSSFSTAPVCILTASNITLMANLTVDSFVFPCGAFLVGGGSQLVSGNITVDVAIGNMDVEDGLVLFVNPSDIVNNSVLIGEYLEPYLIDFSMQKSTLVDAVGPEVDFVNQSVDLGHAQWLVCNNRYFTSVGVLLIGDLISITAGSYLALSQPNDLVSYITIATEYAFDPCASSLALINGTTVTCLLNSTSKSTSAFEEQYSIYLNQGGTLDPSTGDIILVNGSQYNYTDGSTSLPLQFNGDNVMWYFNNNSVDVPAFVPIQTSTSSVTFPISVIINSDGQVFNYAGFEIGQFSANGEFVSTTPSAMVIPAECKNMSMNLFIVNRRSSCAAFGWIPAAVDTSNFDAVSKLIYNCGGPGAQAAIGSWQGSDYDVDFITNYLVFTVGYVGGGGGDVSVATITDGIPFVCQSN